MRTTPWQRRKDVAGLAAQWAYNVDCGRRAARRLPADSYYELRYEDLVADPEAALRKLCGYLKEESAMTEPNGIAPQTVPRRKTWHCRTHEAVAPSRTWSARLTADEIA